MSNNLHAYLLCWLKETKKMPKRGPRSLRAICVRKVQRYLDLKRKLEPEETKELGTAAASQPHLSQNLRLAYPGEIPHKPGFIGFAPWYHCSLVHRMDLSAIGLDLEMVLSA